MKPRDYYFSKENRYSLGIDEETGIRFASIPVSNGIVDYEEYYQLTTEQYSEFMANQQVALLFIEECRQRKQDNLLMQKPGWNRGTPSINWFLSDQLLMAHNRQPCA